METNISETETSVRWQVNLSEIAPGASAVLGNNWLTYYAIHYVALFLIILSILSSLVVLSNIYYKWKESKSRVDFPTRFPLYLAIADTLWSVTHLCDHIYIISTKVYPTNQIVILLFSISLWFFLGYQQLMHASVSLYTYCRVVRSKKLNLGMWEWKLHFLWISFLAICVIFFCYLGSFGITGYWMMDDVTSEKGRILGFMTAITVTFNAICTTLGYMYIRRTVIKYQKKAKSHSESGLETAGKKENLHRKSVASQCLTTYVWIASCLYCPLAVLAWLGQVFTIYFGVIEPALSFCTVVVANSSGLANAWGYFYNERLKQEKQRKMNETVNSTSQQSTNSNTT